jgi:RNA polymerase sigma factor (sigma-70 family)
MKDSVTRLGIAEVVAMPPRRNALDEVLDRIYERHVADVDRWVRRLVGPREDVEDIVHDVFLVAVRRRGTFRGDASVKTWLFRIAHHVVRGRRRRERVRRWLFARHAEGLSAEKGPTTTPLEEIEKSEAVHGPEPSPTEPLPAAIPSTGPAPAEAPPKRLPRVPSSATRSALSHSPPAASPSSRASAPLDDSLSPPAARTDGIRRAGRAGPLGSRRRSLAPGRPRRCTRGCFGISAAISQRPFRQAGQPSLARGIPAMILGAIALLAALEAGAATAAVVVESDSACPSADAIREELYALGGRVAPRSASVIVRNRGDRLTVEFAWPGDAQPETRELAVEPDCGLRAQAAAVVAVRVIDWLRTESLQHEISPSGPSGSAGLPSVEGLLSLGWSFAL